MTITPVTTINIIMISHPHQQQAHDYASYLVKPGHGSGDDEDDDDCEDSDESHDSDGGDGGDGGHGGHGARDEDSQHIILANRLLPFMLGRRWLAPPPKLLPQTP